MRGLAALLLGLFAVGCGDGGGGGGPSGPARVLPGKRLNLLTYRDKALLCDWTNAKLGGYGMYLQCNSGVRLVADASQTECVADWVTTCPATVADYVACANARSCEDLVPPECAPLSSCW